VLFIRSIKIIILFASRVSSTVYTTVEIYHMS